MTTTFSLVPLRAVIDTLPSTHPLVEQARDTRYGTIEEEQVLHVRGDLHLKTLDLDPAFTLESELRQLAGVHDEVSTSFFLLLIEGNLHVENSILNDNTDGATHLVVLGDVTANDIVVGGQMIWVREGLTVRNLLWGDYNHGSLRVEGVSHARIAVFSDEYEVDLAGGEQIGHLLDEVRNVPNLIEFSRERVAAVFLPNMLGKAEAGDESVTSLLDRDAVTAALRDGATVTHKDAEIAAFMVEADDLFIDETLSIQNILRCVGSGVIEGDADNTSSWFDETDFVIGKRRIDSDGDQRDDCVFVTVWKRYNFYLGVEQVPAPEPSGMAQRLKSVLLNRPQPMVNALLLQYRTYTDGAPNDWAPLSETADAVAWAAANKAWRGVLDYVRKAVGQIRAGYPLALRLQQQLTPERLAKLVALPVFAERYADWWGDDCGFWHKEIWVGARQPCEHEGVHYDRAFKMSWENGDDQTGDEDGDSLAAYFIKDAPTIEGGAQLALEYRQRANYAFVVIPQAAADHQARLLRLYSGIEASLLESEQSEASARAAQQRIVASVQLLADPPYAAAVADSEIFPASVLGLSAPWQAQGRAFVASIRAIHAEYESQPDEMPDEEDAWPTDARSATWPTVLQLARVVSARSSPDLSARFRNLFSYAPSAMIDGAAKAGQFIGPLVMLEDGRVVTRVGPDYDDQAYWVLLDGVTSARMPELSGLGRSPNRRCFASCEQGVLRTRDGFQGPEIARFPLPTGLEGLPEMLHLKPSAAARRCDVLIPFNHGKRVLVLNPTGVYSVDESGVQRLHPQTFDEDGPYTWPKNQGDDGLELAMLHMALSPDERCIMVGDQDSEHILLDAQGRYLRGLDPTASYPHHALFSHDGTEVLANSCHLYAGYTSITRVAGDEAPRDFESSWRVYASAATPEFVLLGNAEGYVHAVDYTGAIVWRHHIGSTMSGIDISADGSTLIAASYGGYLVRLEKLAAGQDPYSIGTSPFTETSRWLFWKGEAGPIHW
jgi:hypothetical protein